MSREIDFSCRRCKKQPEPGETFPIDLCPECKSIELKAIRIDFSCSRCKKEPDPGKMFINNLCPVCAPILLKEIRAEMIEANPLNKGLAERMHLHPGIYTSDEKNLTS